MASVSIYDGVKGYLQTALDGAYPVLDFDQLEPAMEQGTAPLIALEEDFGVEELLALGDGACMRETAYITVHVLVPAPESSEIGRGLADTLRDLLRFAAFEGGDVTQVGTAEPQLLNRGLWSALYFLITVQRHFHHDYA